MSLNLGSPDPPALQLHFDDFDGIRLHAVAVDRDSVQQILATRIFRIASYAIGIEIQHPNLAAN
jgi:hypothetical protein